MKRFRFVLFALAFVVLAVTALSLVAPGDVSIERSVRIEAPAALIYPYLVEFRKRLAWYPWYLADPDISLQFEGEEGKVGSVAVWEGNSQVGAGREVITAVDENRRVETTVHLSRPFESEVETDFQLDPDGDQTTVTWRYQGKLHFPITIIGLIMSFGDAVGADFERGLADLKTACERDARHRFNGFQVKEVDFPARVYVGVRDRVAFADTEAFLSSRLTQLGETLEGAGISLTGPPTGLFFRWDEEAQVTWMAATFPVAGTVDLGRESAIIEVPQSKALLVTYRGPYEGSADAHLAIDAYMEKYGLTRVPPVIEEYLVGPSEEADPSKWVTRIYYLFQ